MGLPHQQFNLLLLPVLCTVILVTSQSQPLAEATETEDNIIRIMAFQGKSPRPPSPIPIRAKDECPSGTTCQFHVTCAYQIDKIRYTCDLSGGGTGVCCPPRGGPTKARSVLKQYNPSQTRETTDIQEDLVKYACERGKTYMKEYYEKTECELRRDGMTLERNTPAYNHLRQFKTCPETRDLQMTALQQGYASQYLAEETGRNITEINVNSLCGNCLPMPTCSNPMSKYRTANGKCNNLNNPEWGMSKTALYRLLRPKYQDDIMTPRNESVLGGQLPLVRNVANTILYDADKPDLRHTLSTMQFAQFMDHDLSLSPFPEMIVNCNGTERVKEAIQCCTNDNKLLNSSDLHPLCMPIEIPKNDSFFAKRGNTCMNFIRSNIVCPFESKCKFQHVEQINKLTQWIDGSNVYGSNQTEQDNLRTQCNGLLKTSCNNFLPEDTSEESECTAPERGGICFLAGDSRLNEQPGLAVIHTLWMRQHNRVARELHEINPHWRDETIFQETRRIIAAQIAHITYNEWLPIIIGEKYMEEFDILPRREGFTSDYDPTINANIHNEFSTAAFRFGHSLVQGIMKLFIGSASKVREEPLRNHFNTAHLISQKGFFDGFLRGLTRQRSQKMDNHVTEDLKNHLLQGLNDTFGLDLMSLNIQRGRDHAIGTYNEARELCGLGRAKTFNDLTDTIHPNIVAKLKQENLYKHVDDIDLFVGGLAESSYWYGESGSGILGPTFTCIVGDQFTRLKRADRYYYELKGQPGQFTTEQLDQIRLTSWARILCDNSEDLDRIQPLAFRYPNHFNRLVHCNSSNIPEMNLQPWHEDDDDDKSDNYDNCDVYDDNDDKCEDDDFGNSVLMKNML